MNRITVDINVNEDGTVDSFINMEADGMSYTHVICGISSLIESLAREMNKNGYDGMTKEDICNYVMEYTSKVIVKN